MLAKANTGRDGISTSFSKSAAYWAPLSQVGYNLKISIMWPSAKDPLYQHAIDDVRIPKGIGTIPMKPLNVLVLNQLARTWVYAFRAQHCLKGLNLHP